MDCGPFCLLYLSELYGRSVNVEFVCKECGVSTGGVSMLALNRAATKIGFITHALKLDFTLLKREIKVPYIAYVDGNHFIVILRIDTNYIKIYDPAIGCCKIGKHDFLKRWLVNDSLYGYILVCEPSSEFYSKRQIIKKPKRYLFDTIKYLKQYKKLIFKIVVGLLLGSVLQLLFPILTKQVVDIGIDGKDLNALLLILIGQMVLVISGVIVDFIEGWIVLFAGARLNVQLVYEFFCKLVKLPISFFDTRQSGDIFQRISDQQRIEQFLMNTLLEIVLTIMNFLIFSVIVFVYDTTLFFIILFGHVFYILWIIVFLNKRRQLDYNLFAGFTESQDCTIELVRGMQEIKLCNCYDNKLLNWLNIQKKLYKTRTENLKLGQSQSVGTTFINEILNAVVLFVSASHVISGDITLGTMLAIQYIVGQMSAPIHKSVELIHEIQDAKIAMERLDTVNQHEEENRFDNRNNDYLYKDKTTRIDMENVSFAYNEDDGEVLKDVNLTIEKGKVTAVVGLSGSGKTTLMKLILGFYKPTKGKIYVDKNDLNKINIDKWREQCGVVMQDGYIFSDTIESNIAPDEKSIDKEKLQTVLRLSNLDEYVEMLPLKSKTRVGLNGHGLSIGQKQRILIARALYKNPQVLLFDEATNSLDTHNESEIWNRMKTLFKNKTVLVIAHRLSTIKFADKIVVIDKGIIKESGTHQELMNLHGNYYNLINSQLL